MNPPSDHCRHWPASRTHITYYTFLQLKWKIWQLISADKIPHIVRATHIRHVLHSTQVWQKYPLMRNAPTMMKCTHCPSTNHKYLSKLYRKHKYPPPKSTETMKGRLIRHIPFNNAAIGKLLMSALSL